VEGRGFAGGPRLWTMALLSHIFPPSLPPFLSPLSRYDQFGEAGVEGRGFAGGPQFVDDFDIGDIFDSFFGGTLLPPTLPPSLLLLALLSHGPQFVDDFDIGDIFDPFFGGTLLPPTLPPSLPPSFLQCADV